ncbi:unnamed protein product [Acanthoscelides obtectus]|uniref:Uncharacterized protein n=1 Tax=Acanthoscelides obtectus TaxID=200917 RepID=A0A9P0PGB9_ACAOB|nr:unnamed protein product [Acanthoscelides obtectus]CAK1649465.1 hypothetical protein AOBTE_LOCUS16261 [Acanthoscelides obtectus]
MQKYQPLTKLLSVETLQKGFVCICAAATLFSISSMRMTLAAAKPLYGRQRVNQEGSTEEVVDLVPFLYT